jgi:hypothetical protein
MTVVFIFLSSICFPLAVYFVTPVGLSTDFHKFPDHYGLAAMTGNRQSTMLARRERR